MNLKCCIFYVIIVSLLEKIVYGTVTVISTTEKSFEKNDAISNLTHRLDSLESQLNTIHFHITKLEKSFEKISMAIPKPDNRQHYPENCLEVKERGNTASGVYTIFPRLSSVPFAVYCDMTTKDGGWTYFLYRYDGFLDFFKTWHDYKLGFGGLTKEHWLGLEYLHQITESENTELLVELTDWDNVVAYAQFDDFVVGNEAEGYVLKTVGAYHGDAGDCMTGYIGMKFTTKDKDQDVRPNRNCAVDEHGAWWYTSCSGSNPTSTYLKQAKQAGYRYNIMYWYTFRGDSYSLKRIKMMVRPKRIKN